MNQTLEGNCYFEDLKILGEKVPDVLTCNECGFCDRTTLKCKYRLCPHSSPKTCRDCGYLEFVGDVGVCKASIEKLLRLKRKK